MRQVHLAHQGFTRPVVAVSNEVRVHSADRGAGILVAIVHRHIRDVATRLHNLDALLQIEDRRSLVASRELVSVESDYNFTEIGTSAEEVDVPRVETIEGAAAIDSRK